MASWIVLDWDLDQFQLVCAESSRKGVLVTAATTWDHPEPLTPATAANVGKALRDFLKAKKIAAAPVVVGLGRDRLFLKELRFPAIPAHEEANLVRFQTGKEMAESVERYAIDYVHLPNGGAERQVMAVALRRDLVTMLQNLCQSAGLKLHAITPKLFGMPLALERAVAPERAPLGPKHLNVILNLGQRWGELCFFKGDRLIQVQALANGPLLANEIKRSLAVFQAQAAVNVDLEGPECLYLFGGDSAASENLEAGQALPVRRLDPLKPESALAKTPGNFAGAVGLAALWSKPGDKPVNLTAPKRTQAPASAMQQRGVIYGAVAALAAVILIGIMTYVLSVKRGEVATLTAQKLLQEQQLRDTAQERAELDAYKEWEQTAVPWLDEIYDLTARFPDQVGFRVNNFAAASTPNKVKGAKKVYVAKLSLLGIAPSGKDNLVHQLQSTLLNDPHLKLTPVPIRFNQNWANYEIKVDVAKQDAKKYVAELKIKPREEKTIRLPGRSTPTKGTKKAAPEMDEPEPDPNDGGGQ